VRAVRVTRFGGPEVLALAQLERPSPISTEVLIEVHAAGINPVDYKTRRGSGVATSVGAPPFVLGWDIAGVVVSAGYGVTRFRPGERVFGMPRFPRAGGAYAEYVAAPSLQFARVPQGLDLIHAAAVPLAALTAWQSLIDGADLAAGQRVLVHGASGGVGHLAVQLALAQGASVVATARRERHGFLRALGAQDLIDRDAVPVARAAPRAEIDIAVDLVGGQDTAAMLTTVRRGGVLLAIADGADEVTHAEADDRGVRVLEPLVEPDGRALDQIAKLLAEGTLNVAVEEVLPLEAAAQAHRRLERGGVKGKIVLAVQNSGRSAE
jgi:NADPH:quinone reductase-like Zn-dependent oxidoreductase